MTCGVYEIQNMITNERYIGSSLTIEQRWKSHRTALTRHTHFSAALQSAWDEYGEENFEFRVMLTCDPDVLKDREHWVVFRFQPEYNKNLAKLTAAHRARVKLTEDDFYVLVNGTRDARAYQFPS